MQQRALGNKVSSWMIYALACALVVVVDAVAFTLRWWLAALLLILSYFSMAAGVLTVAAAFAVGVVQFVVGRRSD